MVLVTHEKLGSFRETIFLNEAAIYLRLRIRIAGRNFGFAYSVPRPFDRTLLCRLSIFQGYKLIWRLYGGEGSTNPVNEVQHLRSPNVLYFAHHTHTLN